MQCPYVPHLLPKSLIANFLRPHHPRHHQLQCMRICVCVLMGSLISNFLRPRHHQHQLLFCQRPGIRTTKRCRLAEMCVCVWPKCVCVCVCMRMYVCACVAGISYRQSTHVCVCACVSRMSAGKFLHYLKKHRFVCLVMPIVFGVYVDLPSCMDGHSVHAVCMCAT